ncbi:hypothetical protein HBI23_155630 [Parastagonospora nodorum]|nr:hypothetical protein HBI79_145050 [Parastagonospora nodorum]KAH5299101.1 hypothetical protein HBI12_200520 [Parastagonospora nodorum]KAH5412760.1 hypothetical protein HBI47_154110 [Parastagonospora nodorum]KAH5654083.1 hypothetical protein HBI23_155630 [Parastagonospora nodorum]
MSQIGISHSTLASVPATYTYPDTPDASALALQFEYMSAHWNQGNFDAAQGAKDNAQDRWSTAERQRHRSEPCVEDSSSWRSSCPNFKSLSSKRCKYDGRLIARSVVFHDEALPRCRRIGSQHGLYNFLTPALTTNICISSITTGALLAITLFCTLQPSNHITASLRQTLLLIRLLGAAHEYEANLIALPFGFLGTTLLFVL